MKSSAKMFLALALFGLAVGSVYASVTREFAGIFLFFVFTGANLFLALLCAIAGDPEQIKSRLQARGELEHHEVHLPPPSIWPLVIAVGAAVAGWGLLLKPPVVFLGLFIILAGVAGWAGGFRSINRDLAAWGEVWRYRQYQNLAQIQEELEQMKQEGPAYDKP